MSTMSYLTLRQELGGRLRLDVNQSELSTLIKRWINQSQQEIWGKYDWPWALDREIVETRIDKTAGTVSVSVAGTTVAGSSTAFAAADAGSFIQFSSSKDWYKINSVETSTSLTLEKPYLGTTALSAGTYTIRKVFYNVSANVEKILSMRQTVTPAKLTLVPFRKFDEIRPDPEAVSNPEFWVPFGYDSSNRWTFTVYPFPTVALNLEVRTKKKSVDLAADDDVSLIPEKWHSTVLLDGALYRGLEYLRTSFEDKRSEIKNNQFRSGIDEMIADAEPQSDYHPVIRNKEEDYGIDTYLRLPANYG